MADWYWIPNRLSESLEFTTDIQGTKDAEWRTTMRDATQRFQFTYVALHPAGEDMVEAVRANPLGSWNVPIWSLATINRAGTLATAATVLTVEQSGAYEVGQSVFIGSDHTSYEIGEVASLGAGSITLVSGLASDHVASVQRPVVVAPISTYLAPGGLQFSTAERHKDASIEFICTAPVNLEANPYSTFDGSPVVEGGRVPFSPLSGSMSQANQFVDNGFGAFAVVETESFTRRRGTISFFDSTFDGRWERRQFIHWTRGSAAPFWVPTGKDDLPLVNPIGAADLQIKVRGLGLASDLIGRSIRIAGGGNIVYREIDDATDDVGGVLLTIASTGTAFGTDATISLMHRVRLDVDQVAMNYVFTTGGLAAFTSAPVVEVPV